MAAVTISVTAGSAVEGLTLDQPLVDAIWGPNAPHAHVADRVVAHSELLLKILVALNTGNSLSWATSFVDAHSERTS